MSQRDEFTLVIEAGRPEAHYWRDLWSYRGLFYFLALRDVAVRYKQAVLGVAWALLRPLATMVVFTIVFGTIAGLPSGDVPYALMVFAGLIPWQFFAGAFGGASESLVANANMLSKVYFPRLIFPASAVIVSFVDLLISLVVFAGLMAWYRFSPDARVLFLPAFILLAFALATGAGLWAGALNVRYRDFRHIIPLVVQFGLYLSPVGFSLLVIPENWQLVFSLNPMVGIIEGFRWALLGGSTQLFLPSLYLSIGVTAVLLGTGLRYFRATERSFVDVV